MRTWRLCPASASHARAPNECLVTQTFDPQVNHLCIRFSAERRRIELFDCVSVKNQLSTKDTAHRGWPSRADFHCGGCGRKERPWFENLVKLLIKKSTTWSATVTTTKKMQICRHLSTETHKGRAWMRRRKRVCRQLLSKWLIQTFNPIDVVRRRA